MNYIDLLDKPFEWGGRGPDSYDCYGLCLELARRSGVALPESPWATDPPTIDRLLHMTAAEFRKVETPQPGDLVCFSLRRPFVSHVGYMVTSTEFLHITSGTRVARERLDSIIWVNKIAGFYRWQ